MAIAFIIFIIFFLISDFLGWIGFLLFCFVTYFFRNPPRYTTPIENAIVSAADGTIDKICECEPPRELNLSTNYEWIRISTFLNVFNVHSQRLPVSGLVEKVKYNPGLFINVADEKDSLNNEKYWIIRVTINTCKNNVTSSWKKKVVLNNDYIDLVTIEEERKERFNYYEIITSLPNKYKEAIILFYYENLSIEEIANVLLVSSSCVKKRLERGRQMIKKEIGNGRKA